MKENLDDEDIDYGVKVTADNGKNTGGITGVSSLSSNSSQLCQALELVIYVFRIAVLKSVVVNVM